MIALRVERGVCRRGIATWYDVSGLPNPRVRDRVVARMEFTMLHKMIDGRNVDA